MGRENISGSDGVSAGLDGGMRVSECVARNAPEDSLQSDTHVILSNG